MRNKYYLMLAGFISVLSFSKCTRIEPTPPNPNDIILNYSEIPLKAISYPTAQIMERGYQSEQLQAIKKGLKIEDTESIWYDLETFKNLIWQMEQAAKKVYHGKDKPELGLRVYFGTFPDSLQNYKDLEGVNPEYSGKHNLFFVPTFAEDGKHFNFNPIKNRKDAESDSTKTRFEAEIFEKLSLNNPNQTRSLNITESDVTRSAQREKGSGDNYIIDHGALCPNVCN